MHKSIILAVSALAGVALAQLPSCAQSCVVLPESCSTPDPSCICNDADWITSVACCVFENCDESERQAALDYGNTLCNPVGASLPTTTSECPASSSTAAASSGSSSSSGSTSASATDAAASSSSISSALSSALSSVSSTASGGASTSSSEAFATRVAVADGVGIMGALLGVAALL